MRIVAVLVCLFAVLTVLATVLPMQRVRQNFELLHRVSRLSSAQIVLLYIERSVEGEWSVRGNYLDKGLREFVDGEMFRRALSSYLPPDSVIRFRVGAPSSAGSDQERVGPLSMLPPRDAPPAEGPGASAESAKWRPAIPFLADRGAGIAVRDSAGDPIGWISVESGRNWESLHGSSRNISLVLGIGIINLAVILGFGVVVLRLTKPIDEIAEAHEAASARNAELSSLSNTDPLTRLLNRRGVEAALEGLDAPESRPASVAIIDIDHFKSVNDERGHEEGDRVLAAVAHSIESSIRSGDTCGRWGGEEFIVLFRDSADARNSAERIRAAVEEQSFGGAAAPLRVTVTIGIAEARGSFAAAFSAADAAMYRGKREGRNRVVAA